MFAESIYDNVECFGIRINGPNNKKCISKQLKQPGITKCELFFTNSNEPIPYLMCTNELYISYIASENRFIIKLEFNDHSSLETPHFINAKLLKQNISDLDYKNNILEFTLTNPIIVPNLCDVYDYYMTPHSETIYYKYNFYKDEASCLKFKIYFSDCGVKLLERFLVSIKN